MEFARRMSSVHRSFIREILKAAVDPEVISFAGGLPNPRFFPVRDLEEATRTVLSVDGASALQYATTEGYPPLREKIAERYAARGTRVSPDEILVLNGSQQGLDLVAKAFVDAGDEVLVESPSYLAALQAFGFFEPRFRPLSLERDGVCVRELGEALRSRAKLFYAIPNFQNPSGISYSRDCRREAARLLAGSSTVLVEDDPYGEIRFIGEDLPSLRTFIAELGSTEASVLLGTFSKIVSPGVRLGWMVAGGEIMERLVVAKQAADLHSNELTQRIVHHYLCHSDVNGHIQLIREAYRRQRDLMLGAVKSLFPPGRAVHGARRRDVLVDDPAEGNVGHGLFREGARAESDVRARRGVLSRGVPGERARYHPASQLLQLRRGHDRNRDEETRPRLFTDAVSRYNRSLAGGRA